MSKTTKRQLKQFSVNFPPELVEEIDAIASSAYITRTAWLIQAAQEKIESDRATLQRKLEEKLKEAE